MRVVVLACAGVVSVTAIAAGQQQQRTFASGYAGSLPASPMLQARTYFDDPKVRSLIYQMESGPVSRERVEAAIAGAEYTLADLLRTRILREHDGRFYIAFNYFNERDMRAVHAAAAERVPSLVDAYMARRSEFYRILARYPAKSVPPPLLAYVLVAGFSLNWDGLKITARHGYRRPEFVEGRSEDGREWKYSFWASELVPEHDVRAFFWGSTTFPGGAFNYPADPVDFAFSSFGDPYSDPRMSFPDLLHLPAARMADPVRAIAERIGLADRNELGLSLEEALGLELGRSIGPILFALRREPQAEEALRSVVHEAHAPMLRTILELLEETQYVEFVDGGYCLRVPAFDRDDTDLVNDALALSGEILTGWLAEHYDAIQTELHGLTALRHGVAFESLFTQIWHDFFGFATRELVRAGFMADPYGEAVRYKGSLPAVWRLSLYDFMPG